VNFRGWLNSRKREANERIQLLYQKTMRNVDIATTIKGKQEVDLVNLFLHLNKELVSLHSLSHPFPAYLLSFLPPLLSFLLLSFVPSPFFLSLTIFLPFFPLSSHLDFSTSSYLLRMKASHSCIQTNCENTSRF
jgi:hypothetical protein